MTHSKKSWLNVFNRKEDKMPEEATLWTPDTEEDDVAEYHNPWLALNRDMTMNEVGSNARFV